VARTVVVMAEASVGRRAASVGRRAESAAVASGVRTAVTAEASAGRGRMVARRAVRAEASGGRGRMVARTAVRAEASAGRGRMVARRAVMAEASAGHTVARTAVTAEASEARTEEGCTAGTWAACHGGAWAACCGRRRSRSRVKATSASHCRARPVHSCCSATPASRGAGGGRRRRRGAGGRELRWRLPLRLGSTQRRATGCSVHTAAHASPFIEEERHVRLGRASEVCDEVPPHSDSLVHAMATCMHDLSTQIMGGFMAASSQFHSSWAGPLRATCWPPAACTGRAAPGEDARARRQRPGGSRAGSGAGRSVRFQS
jgi:hypothetical protein